MNVLEIFGWLSLLEMLNWSWPVSMIILWILLGRSCQSCQYHSCNLKLRFCIRTNCASRPVSTIFKTRQGMTPVNWLTDRHARTLTQWTMWSIVIFLYHISNRYCTCLSISTIDSLLSLPFYDRFLPRPTVLIAFFQSPKWIIWTCPEPFY